MQPIYTTRHSRSDKIMGYSLIFSHAVNRFLQIFKNPRFLFHTGRKINRFWLVHFKKAYVHQQILARKGCCRPQACSAFPINQKDINEIKLIGCECGYRFTAALPENCNSKKDS